MLFRSDRSGATVMPALDGDPPAVQLRAWMPQPLMCDYAYRTWSPFPQPVRPWQAVPVAHHLVATWAADLDARDLDHEEAPRDLVRELRGIRPVH